MNLTNGADHSIVWRALLIAPMTGFRKDMMLPIRSLTIIGNTIPDLDLHSSHDQETTQKTLY